MSLDQPSPPDADIQSAQRMQDLATFSSSLVHDLRNPLNVIRTNLYLLRQRLPADDARLTRAIDRIDDQVTASMRILEGLQAFYRADNPAPQRVNLSEIARTATQGFSVPEMVTLDLDLADDLPLISADPQLVEPAVRALLRNGVEALPEGGSVTLRTCRVGDHVRVEICDTGSGVTDEVRARAFEPLFTTRRGHGGIGLAMVQKVAQAHGGRASLEPAGEEGTRAAIEFAVREEAPG